MARSQKRKRKELIASYRRRQEEKAEEQGSSERNMEQETTGAEIPHKKRHVGEVRMKKVDRRTIIIETHLEGSVWTQRGKEIHQVQTNEATQTKEGTKHHIIQNEIEYADDTKLLIEKDTHGRLCERIENYDIITETRDLKIQWAIVEILKQREKTDGAITTAPWPDQAREHRNHIMERNKHEWGHVGSCNIENYKSAEYNWE